MIYRVAFMLFAVLALATSAAVAYDSTGSEAVGTTAPDIVAPNRW